MNEAHIHFLFTRTNIAAEMLPNCIKMKLIILNCYNS